MAAVVGRSTGSLDLNQMASSSAVCAVCGKLHPADQSELFYQRPDAIWALSEAEREKRAKETDDLCALWAAGNGERHRYFVRGVLPIPVDGRDQPYRIGVWVELAEKDFDRVRELWSDPEQHREPAFDGTLANELPANPGALGLPVTLKLTNERERPSVFIASPGHRLFDEQRDGITPHRTYEYTPS